MLIPRRGPLHASHVTVASGGDAELACAEQHTHDSNSIPWAPRRRHQGSGAGHSRVLHGGGAAGGRGAGVVVCGCAAIPSRALLGGVGGAVIRLCADRPARCQRCCLTLSSWQCYSCRTAASVTLCAVPQQRGFPLDQSSASLSNDGTFCKVLSSFAQMLTVLPLAGWAQGTCDGVLRRRRRGGRATSGPRSVWRRCWATCTGRHPSAAPPTCSGCCPLPPRAAAALRPPRACRSPCGRAASSQVHLLIRPSARPVSHTCIAALAASVECVTHCHLLLLSIVSFALQPVSLTRTRGCGCTGLGSGEGGINVWGSVAIPRRRTFEEPDFSKPAKPGLAPAKALPSGPLQEAAARQSAAAAAAATAQHAAARLGSINSNQQAGSTASGSRWGRKQRHGRGRGADQPTAPGWQQNSLLWGSCTAPRVWATLHNVHLHTAHGTSLSLVNCSL